MTTKTNCDGRPARLQPDGEVGPINVMAALTGLAIVLSTLLALPALTPFLIAAPGFAFFYVGMKRERVELAISITWRWAVAVMMWTLLVGVFAPARLGATLPFAVGAADRAAAWVHTAGRPPGGYLYLLWGTALLLLGTLLTGGFLGFVLAAVALGQVAFVAVFLFGSSYNLLEISLLTIPAWQLAALAGGICLIPAVAAVFFERVLKTPFTPAHTARLRRFAVAGTILVGLAFALRLTTSGVWRALLRDATIL